MSSNPLVSVIIPAYNASKYLKEAISSIVDQSYPVKEVLVIDDGSDDHPEDIVRAFGADRVKILHQENSGCGKARNLGVIRSTGEYVAFLDADDVWDPDKLQIQMNKFKNDPEAALIYCDKLWIDENGVPIANCHTQNEFPEGWIFSKLFQANYISCPSCVVVRRAALMKVGGFNESSAFKVTADYELWLRISAQFKCLAVPEQLVRYRRHSQNLTNCTVPRVFGILAALETGSRLLADNLVDPRNKPGEINVNERLRSAYEYACIGLFWAREYPATRKLAAEALNKGLYSWNILWRCGLSIFPGRIVSQAKNIVTAVRSRREAACSR